MIDEKKGSLYSIMLGITDTRLTQENARRAKLESKKRTTKVTHIRGHSLPAKENDFHPITTQNLADSVDS